MPVMRHDETTTAISDSLFGFSDAALRWIGSILSIRACMDGVFVFQAGDLDTH